jgi:hypothetical protein
MPIGDDMHGLTSDNPFFLIALLVAAYVAYRAVQARHRGENAAAAAGKAFAEAAPPAIAAGAGLVLLTLAVTLLFTFLVFGFMIFLFTAPFAMFEAVVTGSDPDWAFGPVHGLAAEAYLFLMLGMLALLAAFVWIAFAMLRRARTPATAPSLLAPPPPAPPAPARLAPPPPPSSLGPPPRRTRERPLRAPGR